MPPAPRSGSMNILLEFFVVTFRVLWAFVLAAAKWLVRPKEKSVAGQVCLITGAGSGLGRLFALEFARRRALLVLWDINTQSNEETAGMVRHIYREMAEEAAAAASGGKRRGSPRCPCRPGAHLPSPGQRERGCAPGGSSPEQRSPAAGPESGSGLQPAGSRSVRRPDRAFASQSRLCARSGERRPTPRSLGLQQRL